MDFLELAKNRYSERFFDPRPVEQEKLDKILEAGRIVPTACNYQPQRFYVLRSPEALAKAKTVTPFTLGSGLSTLPLSVDASACPVIDKGPQTFGILTVANNAETLAATRAMMPRIKAFSGIHNSIVERENSGEGTVTFELLLEQLGTTVLIR